jgi:hypothetical protein
LRAELFGVRIPVEASTFLFMETIHTGCGAH